ncbi:MAG TPA: reverse transcriptase-like protein, partial [Terriglobia bacterium]|nr:reverse transcriptase-like protein [Terriglobia bacterium]
MPETAPPYPLVIHIDGASRGNPGPAAYAVVVETPDGQPVASFAKTLGSTTNNFAEYQALLAALRYATGNGGREVSVISDSELLVRQIQGRYKVKSEDLKPLYDEALKLIRQLDSFSIAHVLREKNREADRLANMALDGRAMEEPPAQSKPPARPAPQIPPTPAPKAKVESHPPVKAEVPPLTALTEEESMLRDAAYEFAANEIAPNVREMDRDGAFKKSLLDQFFAQGFMGVGVPEAYGGSGGTFFMSILAVEEFARVDAS